MPIVAAMVLSARKPAVIEPRSDSTAAPTPVDGSPTTFISSTTGWLGVTGVTGVVSAHVPAAISAWVARWNGKSSES